MEATILGFINQKGGVGKSTLTHLTAKTLAMEPLNKKVRIIEVDHLQATLKTLKETITGATENAPYDLVTCDISGIRAALEVSKFDFIFIDMPGTLDKAGLVEMLMLLDIAFIPIVPNPYDIDSTINFIKKMPQIKETRLKKGGLKFDYYVVLNKVRSRSSAGKQLFDQLEDANINLLQTKLTEYVEYTTHSYNYKPLVGYRNSASEEFENFISEVLEKIINFRNN